MRVFFLKAVYDLRASDVIHFISVPHNTQNSTFQLLFNCFTSQLSCSSLQCLTRRTSGALREKYQNGEFCISFSQVNLTCLNTEVCSHQPSIIVSSLLFSSFLLPPLFSPLSFPFPFLPSLVGCSLIACPLTVLFSLLLASMY